MKNILITLFVVLLAGFIGYDPSIPSQTTAASAPVIPRFIEVPRAEKGFDLTIDLQKDKVLVGNNNSGEANITINKAFEIKPEYKIIEKPVYIYEKDIIQNTLLINRLLPMGKPSPIATVRTEVRKSL